MKVWEQVQSLIVSYRNSLVRQSQQPVAFLRDNKPICYRASIFGADNPITDLPSQLASTSFDWIWNSWGEEIPSSKDAAEKYTPFRMTHNNEHDLVDDFRERDMDGLHRTIIVFGVKRGCAEILLTNDNLIKEVQLFLANENGNIQIILLQLHDDDQQYIYVAHRVVEDTKLLLKVWGMMKGNHIDRPYHQLYSAKLEDLYLMLLKP